MWRAVQSVRHGKIHQPLLLIFGRGLLWVPQENRIRHIILPSLRLKLHTSLCVCLWPSLLHLLSDLKQGCVRICPCFDMSRWEKCGWQMFHEVYDIRTVKLPIQLLKEEVDSVHLHCHWICNNHIWIQISEPTSRFSQRPSTRASSKRKSERLVVGLDFELSS